MRKLSLRIVCSTRTRLGFVSHHLGELIQDVDTICKLLRNLHVWIQVLTFYSKLLIGWSLHKPLKIYTCWNCKCFDKILLKKIWYFLISQTFLFLVVDSKVYLKIGIVLRQSICYMYCIYIHSIKTQTLNNLFLKVSMRKYLI